MRHAYRHVGSAAQEKARFLKSKYIPGGKYRKGVKPGASGNR